MAQRLVRRLGIAVGAMTVALGVGINPANAASAIHTFTTAVPVIGSSLSNSSNQASFPIKDGWSIYDPAGVCSGRTNFYSSDSRAWTTVWTYSGSRSTTTVTGKYQWTARLGAWYELDPYATNCLGNTSSGYGSVSPSLQQEGAATYSAGWSTGSCQCWSGGAVMESSRVGASANFSFYGQMATLVSDKASSRGSASLYIDGKFQKTVSLSNSSPLNRVIVWNSPYLSSGASHILTVKVASGRVDVDAFIVQ
jgi:hypothetical protein